MTDEKKTILIAEDEEFIANLYKMNLEEKGIHVDLVHNGQQAVDYLQSQKPVLLLLDLLMPEKDGFETLAELKEKGISLPIIVLTNLSQEIDRDKCRELGALDFFTKSDLSVEELWNKIQEYVEF